MNKYRIWIDDNMIGTIEAHNEAMALRRWIRLYGRGFAGGNGVYPTLTATLVSY